MNKQFIKFSFATFLSLLGDQLTLIAFPWLLMSLSNEAWVIGMALGLIGLPRALAILAGGVLTDRYNIQKLLVVSRFSSGIVMALMVTLLALGLLSLSFFIFLAFCLGLTSAIGMPATPTFTASLLGSDEDKVRVGNGVILGIAQIAGLVGPIVAGFLLTYFSNTQMELELEGFIYIFIVDMLTFFLAALTIYNIKHYEKKETTLGASFKDTFNEGLSFLFERKFLVLLFTYLAVINFVVHGTIIVGLPILVSEFMGGTPKNYGLLLTTCGVGALFAFASAKFIPSISTRLFFIVLTSLDIITAVLIYSFVNVEFGLYSFAILFFVGFISGFIQLNIFSLLQTKVDKKFRGRMLSFFMFAVFGLVPFSSSIIGWVISSVGVVMAFELMALLLVFTAAGFLMYSAKYRYTYSVVSN
ncbi:MAG: MFS transporter [Psychrobium sp.]|nr:MFS transporter [Psychrobium sp.]